LEFEGFRSGSEPKCYGFPTLVFTVQSPIGLELDELPVNTPLLQLIGSGEIPVEYRSILFSFLCSLRLHF